MENETKCMRKKQGVFLSSEEGEDLYERASEIGTGRLRGLGNRNFPGMNFLQHDSSPG